NVPILNGGLFAARHAAAGSGAAVARPRAVALRPRAQLDRGAQPGAVEPDAGGARCGVGAVRLSGADGRTGVRARGGAVARERGDWGLGIGDWGDWCVMDVNAA